MPIKYHIDAQKRLIIAEVTGEISYSDIFQTITNSVHDPAFRKGFNVLSDHRGIVRVITTDQVEQTINLLKSYSDRLRNAKWAIVTRKPASYGMMRLLSVHAQSIPMEVKVFRNYDAASDWLDANINHRD